MEKLDWNKINNWKTFQCLINDLLALEINHPSFLSSNPEIGKDGGWDARYEGTFMGLTGIWCFQAKWTKHNLNKAYTQLYGELEKELKKAQGNNVQHLLFATNADLRIGIDDHVGNLEKINADKKYVENLFIWPRSNLESRITKHLILKHNYFGDPQEPAFVPPYTFAKSEQLLEDIFVGRDVHIKRFVDFINDDRVNVLIINSVGGYGKTHFIVEMGKKINEWQNTFQSWFCRPGIRDINDAINEIDHNRDIIVFLDDAERYLEETRKLVSHSKSFSPGRLKLVLTCRSSGKNIVRNLIDFQKIKELHELELPTLPEEKLIEILNHVSYPKKIINPDRIVKELNGNLFLITTIGRMFKNKTTVDPGRLKKNIKSDLDQEAKNALSDLLSERKINILLRELSVIVPFSKIKSNVIIDKLSSIIKIDADILDETIDRLIETKILRTIGTSIRFNPDMRGDIYLSVELDHIRGKKLVKDIFENWLSLYPKQIVSNIAAASKHCDTETTSEVVKELVKEWIEEEPKTSLALKFRRLETITPIVFLAPEEIINLSYIYSDSYIIQKDDMYPLNQDIFGPIINQIIFIPGFEKSILGLILHIAKKNTPGTYHNYKPSTLIRQMVSPINVNIASASKALSFILELVTKDDCTLLEAELAKESIFECLSGSHEYHESYGTQYTIGRKLLRYDNSFKKEIDIFRNQGMKILKKLIFYPNDKIKKFGIEAVANIGEKTESVSGNFGKRIIADKEKAIDWLSILINKQPTHKILNTIEKVLIRYWANNKVHSELSAKVANILRRYTRSSEYVIFQYFVAQDLIIDDFSKIENNAPDEDRWKWLVHNHFLSYEVSQNQLDKVVQKLSTKYKTVEKIVKYLNSLEKEICHITQGRYIPLIETWAKHSIEMLIEIINNEQVFRKIPERFHLGIYRVVSDKDDSYVQKIAEEILKNLNYLRNNEVDILLDLLVRHKNVPAKKFIPWLIEISQKADNYLKSIILHRSYFIFKDRTDKEKKYVGKLIKVLLNGNIDSHVLDMVNFLIRHAINWNLSKNDLIKIRKRLFEIIKDTPSIEYHTDNLIKFVVDKDINKFVDLIEYRLKKDGKLFKEKKENRFEAIPYQGLRSVATVVKSYKDFSKLVDKIENWKSKEMLHSSDMNAMLENVKSHDEKHESYLASYIEERINKGDRKNIIKASNVLLGIPFKKDTSYLFFKLLISAQKVNLLKKAQGTFTRQVLSGSYSSNIGEAPPALLEKQKILIREYKKCKPGIIKDYLDSLIKSIGADIQHYIDIGEEFKNPK